jgi:two-component system chemotaxis response regulator CheB
VSEAQDDQPLRPGQVLIAPGGARHMEVSGSSASSVRLRESDLVNGHRPSVDVLFNSVATTCGARSVGVILTGMGKDGAKGLLAMRGAGARTFGQDEASCVVYGMPKAAYEIGAVERQAPLNDLSRLVLDACTPVQRETH